jgi:hypothetical protein
MTLALAVVFHSPPVPIVAKDFLSLIATDDHVVNAPRGTLVESRFRAASMPALAAHGPHSSMQT